MTKKNKELELLTRIQKYIPLPKQRLQSTRNVKDRSSAMFSLRGSLLISTRIATQTYIS